jgi:hypothetical protein
MVAWIFNPSRWIRMYKIPRMSDLENPLILSILIRAVIFLSSSLDSLTTIF